MPTAAVSTSAGPATLSTNNNLLVSWTGAANDIAYLIYSCSGASCTPTLHAVMPHAGAPGATAESYRDFGHAFGTDEDFGTAMRSSGSAQDLFAQITSVSGNSVTLSVAPAQTGSFTMRHDDSVPINAAISSVCSHTATGGTVGGIVEFPATSAYSLGQSLNLYGCWGVTLSLTVAQNGDGGHPVELEWHGVTGGTVINMNKAADSRVAGLSVSGINGNTAGVIIDVDNYTTGGGGDGLATQHDTFERLALGRAGIGIRVANRSTGNVQDLNFRDVQISNPSNGQGGMWGYFFGGGGQTYNEEIRGGLIAGHDVAIMSAFVGQLEIYGTDFEQNKIEAWASDRFGGGADGNMMFSGVTSESAQYFIYDTGANGSNFIVDATSNCRRTRTERFPDAVEPADCDQELLGLRWRDYYLRYQQWQWWKFRNSDANSFDAEQLRRRGAISGRHRQQRAGPPALHGVRRCAGEHRRPCAGWLLEPCAEYRSVFECRNGVGQYDADVRRQLVPENLHRNDGTHVHAVDERAGS